MTNVILQFPSGLSLDIMEKLRPIKMKIDRSPNPEIIVEYIGCEDNWKELLKTIRHNDRIKVITEN
jgi:hypothetical protein